MDRILFRRQVADLLSQVGIEARVDNNDIVVGNYRFPIYRNNTTSVVCNGRRFTRRQVSECAAMIVTELPEAMAAEKRERERAKFQKTIQVLAAGGQQIYAGSGYRVANNVTIAGETTPHGDIYTLTFFSTDLDRFRRVLDIVLILSKGGFEGGNGENLLRSFLQGEGDYTPMLVYADWLEDYDPERAATIRELVAEVQYEDD